MILYSKKWALYAWILLLLTLLLILWLWLWPWMTWRLWIRGRICNIDACMISLLLAWCIKNHSVSACVLIWFLLLFLEFIFKLFSLVLCVLLDILIVLINLFLKLFLILFFDLLNVILMTFGARRDIIWMDQHFKPILALVAVKKSLNHAYCIGCILYLFFIVLHSPFWCFSLNFRIVFVIAFHFLL